MSTFKAPSIKARGKTERKEIIEASEYELEAIVNRKEIYKDSKYFPESKFYAKGANYEPEVRKSIADDLAD